MKRIYSLLLLLFCLAVNAQTETEPNNTFDIADPMGYKTVVTGTIMCGTIVDDNDYFKTLTPVDGTLRVYIERTNTSASNGGYFYLTIYDKLKTQFYNDFNGYVNAGVTRYDTINITCRAADSMFLRINSANVCFSYKLRYEIINNDPVQPFDALPNESFSTASNFKTKTDTIRGRINYIKGGSIDDNDYYKTLTPGDGTLRVYMERTNTSASNGGYFYLSIYDRLQTLFYNDFNGYVDAGATRYDTINITCRAADSMYFRVNNVNTCFTYKLRYEIISNDPVQPFDTAPNESFATARNFRINTDTIRGRINYTKGGSSDDNDYYKTFSPLDGTLRVFIERTNTGVSNGGYFYLSIYDRLQQQFYNDFNGYVDAGAIRYDTIEIPCRGADSIYFRINNVNTCFSYKLRYEIVNENKALDTIDNESFATATNFYMNDTVKGTIKYQKGGFSDNNDYFKAHMPTSGTLRIYLERTNSSASNGGYFYLSLYDKNQTQFYNEFHDYVNAGATRYDTINIYCRSTDSIYFSINNVNTCFNYKLRYEVTLGPDTTVRICPGFTTEIGKLYNVKPFSAVKYENMVSPGPAINSTIVGVGSYRLTVYNGNDECSRDTVIITVAGYPKPNPAFSFNSPQCFSGNSFTFVNTSTISAGTMIYQWFFGDNTSSVATNPTHSYTATGTYNVKLVATSNNGCKDSLTKTVTVSPQPVAGFTINTSSQCLNGNSYIFTNTSTISSGTLSYQWSFGDNTTSASASPSHTFTAAGIYSVRLIATSNNGCNDTIMQTITVYPKPVPAFTINITSQCLDGNRFVFTNTSTMANGTMTYFWSFGDNTSSTALNPSKVYTTAGGYTVKLVVNSNNGCRDSITKTVTVNAKPALGADKPISISCIGGTANITTLYTTTDYTSVSYSTPTPATAIAGIYNLIVSNASGCKDTAVITVDAAPDSTIAAAGANTKNATRECTDATGWTHYYNDNGTATDFSDDILLLSIKKNGNNIGTADDGTFELRTATTSGAGSGEGVTVTNPLITNTSGFWTFNRYWMVKPTRQPGSPVGVRFYYTSQDLNDVNGSNSGHSHQQLVFYKLVDGNPDPTTDLTGAQRIISILNGSQADTTAFTYHQLNTNTHYAEFMVRQLSTGGGGGVTGNNQVLPLNLHTFTAALNAGSIQLNWKTAQEVNTSHFNIQRSVEGNTFKTVGTTKASGLSSATYTFTDLRAHDLGVNKVFYRLQISDKDGGITYSSIAVVNLIAKKVFSISPNPAKNIFYVKGNNIKQVQLSDNVGRIVLDENINTQGVHQLNIAHLAKGMYMVIIKDNDGTTQVEKLIIQ